MPARLVEIYSKLGNVQSYVWLNGQGFSKIMKKADKMLPSAPPGGRSADFDRRLEQEAFRSERLNTVLELYKQIKSREGGGERHEIKLIAGSANRGLCEEIAARLGVPLTRAKISKFNDGECQIQIIDNVRGADVYIIQPTCGPPTRRRTTRARARARAPTRRRAR